MKALNALLVCVALCVASFASGSTTPTVRIPAPQTWLDVGETLSMTHNGITYVFVSDFPDQNTPAAAGIVAHADWMSHHVHIVIDIPQQPGENIDVFWSRVAHAIDQAKLVLPVDP